MLSSLVQRADADIRALNAEKLARGEPAIPNLRHVWTMRASTLLLCLLELFADVVRPTVFFKPSSRVLSSLIKKRGFMLLEDYLQAHPDTPATLVSLLTLRRFLRNLIRLVPTVSASPPNLPPSRPPARLDHPRPPSARTQRRHLSRRLGRAQGGRRGAREEEGDPRGGGCCEGEAAAERRVMRGKMRYRCWVPGFVESVHRHSFSRTYSRSTSSPYFAVVSHLFATFFVLFSAWLVSIRRLRSIASSAAKPARV